MSNSDEAANAEKRNKKLQALRARRLGEDRGIPADLKQTDTAGSRPGKQGGLRRRIIRALAKRKQQGTDTAADTPVAPGAGGAGAGMNPRSDTMVPLRKRARAMIAKKKHMRRQRPNESGVDASSSLEEIVKYRNFLVARIDKLKAALDKRTAELKEVRVLEDSRLAANNADAESDGVIVD